MFHRIRLAIVAAVLACGASAAVFAQTVRYVATDIGVPPGASRAVEGLGINNRGQVVGLSVGDAQSFPFLWTPDRPNGASGTMTDLGLLPTYTSGHAVAVNDFGQVVGRDFDAAGRRQVFLWNPSAPNGTAGTLTEIGAPPPDYEHGRDTGGINAMGQIVGTNDQNAVPRPFLWTPSAPNGAAGTMVELVNPPAITSGHGYALNNRGQVAGMIGDGSRPFLFTPSSPNGSSGTFFELPIPAGYDIWFPGAVNDAGQVVGEAAGESMNGVALWTPDVPNGSTGQLTLVTPRGEVHDINNTGTVVGAAYQGLDTVPFAWDADAGLRDLRTLLASPLPDHWNLGRPMAINDAGQIVALGWYDDGSGTQLERTFLLTPVPEPGATAALSYAAALLALRRRRRVALSSRLRKTW